MNTERPTFNQIDGHFNLNTDFVKGLLRLEHYF